MKTTKIWVLIVLLLIPTILFGTDALAMLRETEPNNTFEQANVFPINGAAFAGQLYSSFDVDVFKFYIGAPELLSFSIKPASLVSGTIRVTIKDSSSNILASKDLSGDSTGINLMANAATSGYYYLVVEGYVQFFQEDYQITPNTSNDDFICSSCPEADLVGSVGPGPAGGSCGSFDFETTSTYQANSRGTGKYRALFSIGNCPVPAPTDPSTAPFSEGKRIGIRLTLLVNGVAGDNLGAYWADPTSANIRFGMYAEPEDTCTATSYTRNFGPGKFYKADGVTEVAATYLGTACVVPAANRAVVVNTNVDSGYLITADDVLNKLSRWWIDIPEMRIDPSLLHNGETISVKIETLDQASGGICATCRATCVCVIDVAKVSSYTPIFNTLTVTSSDPNSGVSITVNPSDNNGQGSGTTPFGRIFNNNASITLTAPSRASGHVFSSWTGCTSTSGATCNVTMNSAKAVTANFVPGLRPNSLPWLLLLLGN